MHIYQLFIIALIIAILFKTKRNSEVLSIVAFHVISIAIYNFLHEDYYNYYYTSMCAVSLIVGKALYIRFRVAGFCAYLLVLVNVLGYIVWFNYYSHHLYDVISSVILIVQFISILPRALLNGMDTTISRYSVVGRSGFDGNKEYATMRKIPQTQEDKK